ncbi:MAG: hypothetical protein JWR34_7395 [Mycobacterium sp.]|nr:hypothetical protein [Mycobacterium sp.]
MSQFDDAIGRASIDHQKRASAAQDHQRTQEQIAGQLAGELPGQLAEFAGYLGTKIPLTTYRRPGTSWSARMKKSPAGFILRARREQGFKGPFVAGYELVTPDGRLWECYVGGSLYVDLSAAALMRGIGFAGLAIVANEGSLQVRTHGGRDDLPRYAPLHEHLARVAVELIAKPISL